MAFVSDNKDAILAIIHGWTGKFSDDLLVKKIQSELGLKKAPSRHTLTKHDEIKLAIQLKREELKDKKSQAIEEAKQHVERGDKLSDLIESLTDDDTTIAELLKLVKKLEDENTKLSSENKTLQVKLDSYIERFIRWQHNLNRMDGVDLNQLDMSVLDRGLPAKNRG